MKIDTKALTAALAPVIKAYLAGELAPLKARIEALEKGQDIERRLKALETRK